MRLVYSLRRKPYLMVILMLLLIGFTTTSIWRSGAIQKGTVASRAEMKRNFQEQMKSGVGTEVRFAPAASSSQQVRESVDSVANFIQQRSGLGMSPATRESLGRMELTALQSGSRISATQLSAALAETLTERMATLSDGEIAKAEQILSRGGQEVLLRADGEYRLSKEGFAAEARNLRRQLAAGDGAAANAIRAIVNNQVEERISGLSEAAGDQFGRAPQEGLSPLQALVVTYSVLTDDNLANSSNNLKQMARTTLSGRAKNERTDLAYGPEGRLFSTPVHLFFNQEVMGRFLDRLTKGGDR